MKPVSLVEAQIDAYCRQGWTQKKNSFTNLQAQIKGFCFALPFLLLAGGLYRVFLLPRAVLLELQGMMFTLILAGLIVLCCPLHEALHGLGWAGFGRKGWGAVSFQISGFMPMCSCSAVLSVARYLVGVLLPLLILGGGSLVFLLLYPGTVSLLAVMVNFYMAGADLAIAFAALRSNAHLIADSPDSAGFIALYR